MATLLCFGSGYCGRRIAAALEARGWSVVATTRGPVGPGTIRFGSPLPAGVTHLLSTAPPDDEGDPVLRTYAAELRRLAPSLAWAGYLSSTAVYGDRQGAWVDATHAPAPTSERGRARLAAERAWQAALPGVHLFRLAGIYGPGPGRSAIDAVRAGRARRVHKAGHVFSRIHVDDVVAAVLASIDRPRPGAVYDLADELPAPHDEVVAHACALLGVAPQPLEPWETADVSPALREFYAESRRVSGARTRAELGLALKHPDYRAGLASLLDTHP